MSQDTKEKHNWMWHDFVRSQEEAESIRVTLLSGSRVELLRCLREALARPGERLYALRLLRAMPEDDRKAMLPDLLALSTWQNQVTEMARELVFSISRAWLQQNILQAAEALLKGTDYQEFLGFLDILQQIDPKKALELARRLASHHDREIREAGEIFLKTTSPPNESGLS